MGEIRKQVEAGDRPERTNEPDEDIPRYLRIKLSQIDFVSPVGALHASQHTPELTLAPKTSEVWRDWREDLGRRIARTAERADQVLEDVTS